MSFALLVRKFIITLILVIFTNISKVEAADTVINDGGTTTSQQGLSSDGDTLTISNESTLSRSNTAVNVTADEVSVTVNSGSTIKTSSADKAIYTNDVEDLTVTNSGTLDAVRGKTIDIKWSNRVILQHQKKLATKFSDLPIIKSDTNDIIEHTNEVEKFLSKKPRYFWILIKDNAFDIIESINEIEEFNNKNKFL